MAHVLVSAERHRVTASKKVFAQRLVTDGEHRRHVPARVSAGTMVRRRQHRRMDANGGHAVACTRCPSSR